MAVAALVVLLVGHVVARRTRAVRMRMRRRRAHLAEMEAEDADVDEFRAESELDTGGAPVDDVLPDEHRED